MRILLVHEYGTLNGGAEHMTDRLRAGLRRRGHQVEWLSSTARPLPLPIVADRTCFGTFGPLQRVGQALNPNAANALRRTLRDFRPDVVHCRMFMSQLSPLILPELAEVPALLHVVNYNNVCPINTKMLPDRRPCHEPAGAACVRNGCFGLTGWARTAVQHRLWRRWRHVFDRVIANSHWTRSRLEAESIRVDGVIHNGVPVSVPRGRLEGPPRVGFAGRLIPKKGVDVLLRAFARVVEAAPEARLDIAGDGPQRAALARLAAELGIAGSVRWHGHLDRPAFERVFARAWAQAVPSVWEEPFGLVAAEASMRGTALVVSARGGLSEIALDGETGYTVPNGDVDALASALSRLLRDRARAERLGTAGRARALAEFDEERTVGRFEAAYRELAGCPAEAPEPASPLEVGAAP